MKRPTVHVPAKDILQKKADMDSSSEESMLSQQLCPITGNATGATRKRLLGGEGHV